MPSDESGLPVIVPGVGSWCKIRGVTDTTAGTEEVVMTVAPDAKNKILSGAPSLSDSVHQKAEGVLAGIHNNAVSALFGFKATAVSKAPFRLVKRIPKGSKHESSNPTESFIALSYCWHNNDWSAKGGSRNPARDSKIPISPVLFEALLEERISDDEGIWIDQLCINQSDNEEKALAIGSMDVIYQRARLAAVVLEDIVIDQDDKQALQSLVETFKRDGKWFYREKLETSRQLTKLTWKIFSARWFTRAWCGHELLVSSDQIFLIRCSACDGQSSSMVVKMTSSFLFDLSILAKSVSSHINTHEFDALEKTYGDRLSRFYVHLTKKLNPNWATPSKAAEDPSFTQSYMLVFKRIFGFEASVTSDKLSIALNVLQCGLFFKGPPSMTQEQCCYAFYHISLAARDPTCLSVCGKRLQQAAWMRWPRDIDIMEPYPTRSRHRRLEEIPKFDDKGIELDLALLGSSKTMCHASSTHIAWADRVLQKCADYVDDVEDQGNVFLDQITRAPQGIENPRRRFYAELIACIRECGIEWLVRSWAMRDPALFDERTEQALRRIMKTDYNESRKLTESERADLVYVTYLIDAILGAWLLEESGLLWKPVWIQNVDRTGPLLFLCPEGEEFRIVIPEMILSAEHGFLRRIWFLVPDCRGGVVGHWTVMRKSYCFGELDLSELQRTQPLMKSQIICG